MTTFVLVHGGMHGAWCWGLLTDALGRRGHRGVAMDVPLHDPAARMPDHVAAVTDAMAGLGDDTVLVGHSLGGLIVPHVAAQRRVAGIVFLTAMIAPTTPAEMAGNLALVDPTFWARAQVDDRGRSVCPPEVAVPAFFPDVPPDVAAWAAGRLVPLAPAIVTEPAFLDTLPDVPMAAIVTTDDAMSVGTEASRAHVRTRLGVEPALLPGSHSPFLSRPDALALTLEELACRLSSIPPSSIPTTPG